MNTSRAFLAFLIAASLACALLAITIRNEPRPPLSPEQQAKMTELIKAEPGELIETELGVLFLAERDDGFLRVVRWRDDPGRMKSAEEIARSTIYVTSGRERDARYAALASRFLLGTRKQPTDPYPYQ